MRRVVCGRPFEILKSARLTSFHSHISCELFCFLLFRVSTDGHLDVNLVVTGSVFDSLSCLFCFFVLFLFFFDEFFLIDQSLFFVILSTPSRYALRYGKSS